MKDGICFKEYIYYLLMVCEVTDLEFWTQTLDFKILMKDGICFKEYIYYLLMVCEDTDLGFWTQTLDFSIC